jgi:hypothetical protein
MGKGGTAQLSVLTIHAAPHGSLPLPSAKGEDEGEGCSKRIHESDSHSAESIRPLLMRDFAPPALPRSFSEAVCQRLKLPN